MHEAGDSTPSVFALVDRILPVALIASTCAVLFWVCFCRPEGETVQTPATCCSEGGSSIEPSIVVFDEALHTSLIAKAAANGVYIMCLLSCSRGHRTSRCFGSEKMLRLGHILGVAIYVSLPWHPAASEAAACPDAVCKETQAVFDEVDSADEEALRLELLQVSTKLERRGGEQHAQLTAVQNVPGTDRQSVFGSLLAANAGRLSFVLAVVLPHAVAFSISLFLRRRVGGPQKTVEVLQEEEQLEPPRSTSVLFGNIKR